MERTGRPAVKISQDKNSLWKRKNVCFKIRGMTHTQWIGWLSSDPQKMNGSLWKAEQVGSLLSSSMYFREGALRSPRRPVAFPITSKRDNGMTCYLRPFSIRKLSNYCSPSWARRRPRAKSSQWGMEEAEWAARNPPESGCQTAPPPPGSASLT